LEPALLFIILLTLIVTDIVLTVSITKTDVKQELAKIEKEKQKNRYFKYVKAVKECKELHNFQPPLPKRATADSACYDVYAPYDFILDPKETKKVPTYLKAYMNSGEVLQAYPRSSLGFKYNCQLLNTVGIIDKDYVDNKENEGHIWVGIKNNGNKPMEIKKGTAFCQFQFANFLLVKDDDFTGKKRSGGFGSTNGS